MTSQTLIDILTPLVAPVATWLWIKYHQRLPTWLIPPLCVSLGALGNALAKEMAGGEANLWMAVLGGLGAIGVREVTNQLRKGLNVLPPTGDAELPPKNAEHAKNPGTMLSCFCLGYLLLRAGGLTVAAETITFTWDDPNPAGTVQRYRFYQAALPATNFVRLGETTNRLFAVTAGVGRYRWRVTALDATRESQPSNELERQVGPVLEGLLPLDALREVRQTVFANGSFEAGLAGWLAQGNMAVSTRANAGTNAISFNAGNKAPNGWLSQAVLATPGQKYALTLDLGVYGWQRQEQRLRVRISGQSLLLDKTLSITCLTNAVNIYQPERIEFVADSSALVLDLSDVSAVTDNIDLLLDNVRLTAE